MGSLLFLSLVPISGNFDLRIVQSGSMEPAIKTGSMVFIKSTDRYRVNDVITFAVQEQEYTPITHRIIEREIEDDEYIFTTQGDANRTPDIKTVRENQIMGKVLFSIPFLGYVMDFARKPFGFFALIVLPFLIISTEEIIKIVKTVNADNKNI